MQDQLVISRTEGPASHADPDTVYEASRVKPHQLSDGFAVLDAIGNINRRLSLIQRHVIGEMERAEAADRPLDLRSPHDQWPLAVTSGDLALVCDTLGVRFVCRCRAAIRQTARRTPKHKTHRAFSVMLGRRFDTPPDPE